MKKISSDLKDLVLVRLEVMPSNYKLSVGDKGTLSKKEMIEHVKKGDETGVQIANMQLNFIKAVTSGKFVEALND